MQTLSKTIWCLRIGVLLESFGVGGRYVLSRNESESPVFGLLYFEYDWAEQTAQTIDDWGTVVCCCAGAIVVLAALLQQRSNRTAVSSKRVATGRAIEGIAAFAVGLWMFTLAVCQMLRGEAYAELSLGEHAVRYTLPCVLAASCWFKTDAAKVTLQRFCVWGLAVASAATFVVHGYKALICYGPFTDLILLSDARCFGVEISQSLAESMLVAIGVVDILVAIVLLASRWRYAALYMAVWGLVTAASRTTAFGLQAWPETLIRSANWAAPFALYLLCCALMRSRTMVDERPVLCDT